VTSKPFKFGSDLRLRVTPELEAPSLGHHHDDSELRNAPQAASAAREGKTKVVLGRIS
jgi:hypothetical protein